jgi:hypothetical protein
MTITAPVTEISRGSQDVTYREMLELYDYRCRITIKSDSHQEQCHARLEVWSRASLSWNEVASIPPSSMRTLRTLCYAISSGAAKIEDFLEDRNQLVVRAQAVLV